MAEQTEYIFEVPEQGINEVLTQEAALKFFDEKLAFFSRISSITAGALVAGGTNWGESRLGANATRELQTIRKQISEGENAALNAYISRARELRIVIGQGTIGQTVERLMANGDAPQARWTMYIFAKDWLAAQDRAQEAFAPIRAAAMGGPAFHSLLDVIAAEEARTAAMEAKTAIEADEARLNTFLREKTELFTSLEDVYRRKLVFEEPAISWEKVSVKKTTAWRWWLAIFATLIVGPIAVVLYDWANISRNVIALTSTSSGTISVAGVAAISIPALLYAWLLKNVSRVFLQNLSLADDADHRRTLAITYLGLAENPKLAVMDSERALILNALFRPIPSSVGEEGPPMGLLDLVRN